MAEDRSESSQDVERIEERYSEKNEAFLISIKEQCLEVANEHDVQSHSTKKAQLLFYTLHLLTNRSRGSQQFYPARIWVCQRIRSLCIWGHQRVTQFQKLQQEIPTTR